MSDERVFMGYQEGDPITAKTLNVMRGLHDAGYAQAIKDVVEDLRLNAGMCITAEAQHFNRVLAVRIESRFSAPSPEGEETPDG